ncbi:MAG: RNA methyltransferase [Phycisphaerales bacterium]|nr:RNA methyltransferase [Phycisphaerales bacterium]
MIEIHDPKDPRIEVFLNQKDAWLKAAHHPKAERSNNSVQEDGFFIAEGVLVVEQLLRSRFSTHSILVTNQRAVSIRETLSLVPSGVPIYCVTQELMDEIVGFPIHRGLLACGERMSNPDPIELAKSCRALVVLEDLSNHDNVGSVFRSVAALGGRGVGVWLSQRCCDPLYRKALRVSMGHVLNVPFSIVEDLPPKIEELGSMGFTTIAFTPDNNAIPIGDTPKVGVEKPVLIFGAEGPGLSERVLECSERCVRIEMTNDVDSLNIAVSAAVSMHRYLDPYES